ncbi:Putative Acyl transferase domain superfamily, Acyl transferase/acyl hydrolase/lysophospholipase [Colletotrichum destructivum]|uniref:Acyl transferase domain superfamily, Acyl transferase/acyl hydrolase/lysophospholipase n=1 Tax=Colletotrichum destructivum TaxID=34406 RepID=A0AAX4I6Z4_9PEZI|nr:Putative Acyl transferase domain superfamily, Acyl transferase/acyl hydrolase/lysophospholipase [Colletotrichum destructivum]
MLAVGLSWDGASGLCARPEYVGRISVAAANSPTSVTLSGDADVIDQVEAHLTAEGTFARKLKVDMAYHSRHMEACAPAYLASLRSCGIQVQQPDPVGCVWVSSVRGDVDSVLADVEKDDNDNNDANDDDDDDDDDDDGSRLGVVRDQYWVDNLTNPVLFEPAVECALWRAGPFDAVVEVGPHPALKGPATNIFKASLGASLPYVSVMQRGHDEVEAFSSGLGYLWEHLGSAVPIDFDGYRRAFYAFDGVAGAGVEAGAGARTPRLVKSLPAYRWDHSKVHWRESRLSRNFRLADRPYHGLLGRRTPDSTPGRMR